MKLKGFIAAPLIGTAIFLVAIFFIVNLSKTESSAVSSIADNAYHSRLVSLMELYRSDLKSVFKTGISNLVESQISKQCWNYPLTIQYHLDATGKTKLDPITANGLGFFQQSYQYRNEVDLRLDYCYRLKRILGSLVQSSANGSSLRDWLVNLNNSITFEGITFDIASQSKFSEFKNKLNSYLGWDPATVPADSKDACIGSSDSGSIPRCDNLGLPGGNPSDKLCHDQYTIGICSQGSEVQQLLGNGLFDCYYFALKADPVNNINKYSCCTPKGAQAQDDYYTAVQGGEKFNPQKLSDLACLPTRDNYLAGCENGQFYYQLNVQNPQVYPLLPRITASDGKGNIIRSGGLADTNDYLLIRYPFFKYYDMSLQFVRGIALGVTNIGGVDFPDTSTKSPGSDLSLNGFFVGSCFSNNTANCPKNFHEKTLISKDQSVDLNTVLSTILMPKIRTLYSAVTNKVAPIGSTYAINFSGDSITEFNLNDPLMNTLISPGLLPFTTVSPNGQGFLLQAIRHYIKIEDTNPTVQISPTNPNTFCIAVDLALDTS